MKFRTVKPIYVKGEITLSVYPDVPCKLVLFANGERAGTAICEAKELRKLFEIPDHRNVNCFVDEEK